jgi:hypothetical protein
MISVLHILTRKNDSLATDVIREQQAQAAIRVETFDLTEPRPDYDQLVDRLFEADSVQVW